MAKKKGKKKSKDAQKTEDVPAPPKGMYFFIVKDPSEIDVQRICDEAVQDNKNVDAVLVTGKFNSLILLRDSFLKKFTINDDVAVGGEKLQPSWGELSVLAVQIQGNTVDFISTNTAHAGTEVQSITGWRCRSVMTRGNHVKEVRKARRFRRRFKINVHLI